MSIFFFKNFILFTFLDLFFFLFLSLFLGFSFYFLKKNTLLNSFFSIFFKLVLANSLVFLFYTFWIFSSFNYFSLNFQILFSVFGFFFGVDVLNLFFILLLNFLIFVVLAHYYFLNKTSSFFLERSENEKKGLVKDSFFFSFYRKKEFLFVFFLLLLQLALFIFFSVLDLFFFYLSFEFSMLPLFFLINFFGKRKQRIKASYYLFFFTLLSSLPFFIAIFYIWTFVGSTNILFLYLIDFPASIQYVLWVFFFLPFATKIPIFPFHIWLPEAHVEASTEGSVLLAGLLLKIGFYGIFRLLIPLFPLATAFYTPLVFLIGITSLLYASFSVLRQVDLKKIIAYSSIVHTNIVLLAIFSGQKEGILGGILMLFIHGIVSSGLFICVGLLYQRFHTRYVHYFCGLSQSMPLFSFFFFILILGNFSFPGTASFVAEILMILSMGQKNLIALFFLLVGSFLSTAFSLILFVRVCFGVPYPLQYLFPFASDKKKELVFAGIGTEKRSFLETIYIFFDLNIYETSLSFLLVFLTLFLGLQPAIYLNFLESYSSFLTLFFI